MNAFKSIFIALIIALIISARVDIRRFVAIRERLEAMEVQLDYLTARVNEETALLFALESSLDDLASSDMYQRSVMSGTAGMLEDLLIRGYLK
jgi:hypothetical protein